MLGNFYYAKKNSDSVQTVYFGSQIQRRDSSWDKLIKLPHFSFYHYLVKPNFELKISEHFAVMKFFTENLKNKTVIFNKMIYIMKFIC